MNDTENQELNGQTDSPKRRFSPVQIILTTILLGALLAVGIFVYWDSTPTTDEQASNNQVEQEIEELTSGEDVPVPDTNEENSQVSDTNPEESVTGGSNEETLQPIESGTPSSITETAQAGEGVTHLARRAIAQYVNTQGTTSLSVEQKLFAETTLKNQYYKQSLQVGESISFETDSLAQVVQSAQNLSQDQIQAWNAYVHLVPSLSP